MQHTVDMIERHKIIVIVRGVDGKDLIPLAEAMYAGGIRLMECTFDASGKTPDAVVAGNIEILQQHFGDRMRIGAGTVLSPQQAELVKAAGGSFVISPDTNPEVIKRTKGLGLVSIPGAITPSEITAAHRAGADFVKLFPADLYGAKYIKALQAPLSHIKLLAVGNVTPEAAVDYMAAGAHGVCVGSAIVDKKRIASGDLAGITALAKQFTENL